jgi:hypothetical protein
VSTKVSTLVFQALFFRVIDFRLSALFEGIFALNSANRLDGISAADRFSADLAKTEMLHFALSN